MAAYANMIARFAKPGSVFACVSDSYDLWNAIDNLWGEKLRRNVCDSGATLVVRPDSGDPITIVSKAVQRLDAKFGSKTNSKGFRVLNNVRVIQGDGINDESVGDILSLLMACGYSATNVAFGMGGALLQCHNRDTNKFAMKCSSITVNNVETDVFKDPVTDKNKKSKAGRLDLINDGDAYTTVRLENGAVEADNTAMVTVYENGAVRHTWTLDEIRARVDKK
jgi:nicotinamide phosphoribosyltransferase